MAYIVEVIGPRGAGKTTIYEALKQKRRRKDPWAPASFFMPKIAESKFGSAKYFYRKAKNFFGEPLENKTAISEAAYRFQKENADFVNLCWQLIDKNQNNDHNGIDNRFRSASSFYGYCAKYQLLVESESHTQICITEGSILHSIWHVTNENLIRKDIIEFAMSVPVADAVIIMDAPAKIIAQRSYSRPVILSHKGKSLNDLCSSAESDREKIKLIKESLKQRAIPLFELNTEKSVEHSTDQIIRFIDELGGKE